MSAELCLHGADVWIKTLECQLRNFPGNCITRPPDMKNSSAGRHFPPLSILGTCTSKGKKKKQRRQRWQQQKPPNFKEKSNKQMKNCCIQQEKCERRESEGSLSQGVADEVQSDNILQYFSQICGMKHDMKYNAYLISLTLTRSKAINISLQNNFCRK